jgi:hypothetical protein
MHPECATEPFLRRRSRQGRATRAPHGPQAYDADDVAIIGKVGCHTGTAPHVCRTDTPPPPRQASLTYTQHAIKPLLKVAPTPVTVHPLKADRYNLDEVTPSAMGGQGAIEGNATQYSALSLVRK